MRGLLSPFLFTNISYPLAYTVLKDTHKLVRSSNRKYSKRASCQNQVQLKELVFHFQDDNLQGQNHQKYT